MLYSIALKLVTVGCAEYLVPSNLGGDYLADDILVGKADNEAVFGGIVFVLGLGNEALAGIVVRLTCPATLVFGLVAAVRL